MGKGVDGGEGRVVQGRVRGAKVCYGRGGLGKGG